MVTCERLTCPLSVPRFLSFFDIHEPMSVIITLEKMTNNNYLWVSLSLSLYLPSFLSSPLKHRCIAYLAEITKIVWIFKKIHSMGMVILIFTFTVYSDLEKSRYKTHLWLRLMLVTAQQLITEICEVFGNFLPMKNVSIGYLFKCHEMTDVDDKATRNSVIYECCLSKARVKVRQGYAW